MLVYTKIFCLFFEVLLRFLMQIGGVSGFNVFSNSEYALVASK